MMTITPNLQLLFDLLRPAPEDWFTDLASNVPKSTLEELPCESYADLVGYWKKAMTWNAYLDLALSSCCATIAGTKLQGDQVWLRLIGIAGTAKTTLCEAFSANRTYCYPLSMLTGIHSGFKDSSGKDFSLIDRLNGLTAILNEGDMLLKAPNRDQIMAQLRDLYSGVTRNDYRHKEAQSYEGIRTSFILAGTPKIRALNSSALGDRFLDCKIYEKQSDHEESELVRNVLFQNRKRRISESNGEPQNTDSPEKIEAKQRTAGFVTYLRENVVATLGSMVNSSQDKTLSRVDHDCEKLGKLVAYMRTRLGTDEEPTEKELHIRLGEQLCKLAYCTSFVMNRPIGDPEVMRRVALVADETCFGNPYRICKALVNRQLDRTGITLSLKKGEDVARKAIRVLIELELLTTKGSKGGKFRKGSTIYTLSPRAIGLLGKLKSLLSQGAKED